LRVFGVLQKNRDHVLVGGVLMRRVVTVKGLVSVLVPLVLFMILHARASGEIRRFNLWPQL
jgi:hypothetical protein